MLTAIMIQIQTAFTILTLVGIIGCGKVPDAANPNTPDEPTIVTDDGSPAVAPIVVAPAPGQTVSVINFTKLSGSLYSICQAVKAWSPSTQTIRFPIVNNSTSKYSFESTGVYIIDVSGNVTNAGNHTLGFNPYCTIVMKNGQFVSVN